MVPGMNFIVESRKKFDNGNPAITGPGSRFSAVDCRPEVSYFQGTESASLMEDGMAIPATKRRYNVTLDAALAARLDAVAALRHKHRSTIIHWAVEDWLRRYEPGIQAGLAGGSQAAMAAKAPSPASDDDPDPRQIDLEDAIGALPSSLDGDRLC